VPPCPALFCCDCYCCFLFSWGPHEIFLSFFLYLFILPRLVWNCDSPNISHPSS
jgi:hypothetical protein